MKVLSGPLDYVNFTHGVHHRGMPRVQDYGCAARREMAPDFQLAGPASRRATSRHNRSRTRGVRSFRRSHHFRLRELPIRYDWRLNKASATGDSSVGTSALERTSRNLGAGGGGGEYTPAKGRKRERRTSRCGSARR